LSGEGLELMRRMEEVMWKTRRMEWKTVEWAYFLKNLNLCHEAGVKK